MQISKQSLCFFNFEKRKTSQKSLLHYSRQDITINLRTVYRVQQIKTRLCKVPRILYSTVVWNCLLVLLLQLQRVWGSKWLRNSFWMHMAVTHLSGLHCQWYCSDLVECMCTQQTAYQDFAHCTRPVLLIKAIKYMQCLSRTVNALWFTHFSHHHTTYGLIKLDVLNQ